MPVRKTKSMGPSPRTWYPIRSFPSLANFVVGRIAQMSQPKSARDLQKLEGMDAPITSSVPTMVDERKPCALLDARHFGQQLYTF